MTLNVIDVGAAPVGGPIDIGSNESNLVQAGQVLLRRLRYRPAPRGRIYRVVLAPQRLTALIERTEQGFVATCPQLDSLGYGPEPESALTDLMEATREYLSLLAEDHPPLAPRIASHALYVPLLATSQASWFAAVTTIGDPRQDAS